MKRTVLISLLAAAVGVMTFIGCERPEPIEVPVVRKPQTADTTTNAPQQEEEESQDTTTNPYSFIIGEWAVNTSMSNVMNPNYKDTLLFTDSGMIEKHSTLAGCRYYVLNDTTLKLERANWSSNITFKYYSPNGIMFYNFYDNTALNYIKNIYYERVLQ